MTYSPTFLTFLTHLLGIVRSRFFLHYLLLWASLRSLTYALLTLSSSCFLNRLLSTPFLGLWLCLFIDYRRGVAFGHNEAASIAQASMEALPHPLGFENWLLQNFFICCQLDSLIIVRFEFRPLCDMWFACPLHFSLELLTSWPWVSLSGLFVRGPMSLPSEC